MKIPGPFATLTSTLALSLLTAGCSTTPWKSSADVKAVVNPMAPETPDRTFTFILPNRDAGEWFTADRESLETLRLALEKRGYMPAADPRLATHVIEVKISLGERPILNREAANPDSVRYQNVAAITGGGRYTQILTDQRSDPGTLLVGPEGKIIPTGQWKQMIQDEEERMETAQSDPSDHLLLRAWDISDPRRDGVFVWQVEVTSDAGFRYPTPQEFGFLLQMAASRLEAGFTGPQVAESTTPPESR